MPKRNQNHDDDASSSRKVSRTFENGFVATWSNLDHDVLVQVMMQLGVVDFLAFSCVCKSWRSLALSNKKTFMPLKPPMPISIEPRANNQDSCCYLNDFEGRRFKTVIPHSAGRKCVGLTGGYVVLFGSETRDFWLVNPITRHELHFPHYPLDVSAEEEIKAIIVFSPLVSRLVFVVLKQYISFSIVGEQRWDHVSSTPRIVDIHVFKGKIYTLHTDLSLRELRLNPYQTHKWTLLENNDSLNPYLDMYVAYRPLLVSSRENLYVMTRRKVPPKKVMELDFGEMKWVSPEKKIEEYAFFVSWFNYFGAFKWESWADPRRQHRSYEYFLDNDKSRKCMFYHDSMWYFPHDCLNVNLLDE